MYPKNNSKIVEQKVFFSDTCLATKLFSSYCYISMPDMNQLIICVQSSIHKLQI